MAHPPHRPMDRSSRVQRAALTATLVLLVAVVVLALRYPDLFGVGVEHGGHDPLRLP